MDRSMNSAMIPSRKPDNSTTSKTSEPGGPQRPPRRRKRQRPQRRRKQYRPPRRRKQYRPPKRRSRQPQQLRRCPEAEAEAAADPGEPSASTAPTARAPKPVASLMGRATRRGVEGGFTRAVPGIVGGGPGRRSGDNPSFALRCPVVRRRGRGRGRRRQPRGSLRRARSGRSRWCAAAGSVWGRCRTPRPGPRSRGWRRIPPMSAPRPAESMKGHSAEIHHEAPRGGMVGQRLPELGHGVGIELAGGSGARGTTRHRCGTTRCPAQAGG